VTEEQIEACAQLWRYYPGAVGINSDRPDALRVYDSLVKLGRATVTRYQGEHAYILSDWAAQERMQTIQRHAQAN
jgi:hypothetical protein